MWPLATSLLQYLNRHSPDSRWLCGALIALSADLVNGLSRVAWATGGPNGQLTVSGDERPCFALIKAYLCRGSLSHLSPSAPHAGVGGARSRAIIERISWNALGALLLVLLGPLNLLLRHGPHDIAPTPQFAVEPLREPAA